jgi:SNF2 family DNA or RNA helicase
MKTIKNYTPFQFQYASILQHIENVQNNNGACIFDETGLGKTITAATIAINLTSGPILIVSPLANKDSWVQVLQHIDNKYTICTSTKIPEGVYSFVIVDEAHNFKSIKTKSYLALFKIIKLAQCQVLLLSATPFQNKLLELRTMVSLINFHTNTPAFVLLGLLFNSIKDTEKTLDNLARYKGDIETSGFAYRDINVKVENEFKLDFYMKMLAGVFATFSHRNTRVDIEENYKTDVELMGRFPKKHTKLITYGNEEAFKKCFWKTISILNECPLVMQNIYNYHPTKMKGQQLSMGGIMRSFLLKRLDSSVYAFKKSLQNAYDKLIDIENQKGKEVLEIDGEEVPIMPEFWKTIPGIVPCFGN